MSTPDESKRVDDLIWEWAVSEAQKPGFDEFWEHVANPEIADVDEVAEAVDDLDWQGVLDDYSRGDDGGREIGQ